MKKIAFLLVGIFVVGWAVRVLVPYWQTLQSNDDLRNRRDSFELLVNRLYEFAETNAGLFPANLEELGLITNRSGKLINIGNYILRPFARSHSEKIDGRKLVVGENPSILPNRNLYLLSVEGRYTMTLGLAKYGPLLIENGFNSTQDVNAPH